MTGYYDPHPRFQLDQSLVLLGHPGAGAAHVAHSLAARTGLPFTEVERWSEAAAGMSRARLLSEQGLEALRDTDAGAVRRAVARRPSGFISMGSGCLDRAESRALVEESCCVVLLRRPLDVLAQRIRQQIEQSPGSLVEFLAGPPPTPETLSIWLRRRAAAEATAHAQIEAGDRHASRIADEVMASLGRLAGLSELDASAAV